jgi:hypothetical protein
VDLSPPSNEGGAVDETTAPNHIGAPRRCPAIPVLTHREGSGCGSTQETLRASTTVTPKACGGQGAASLGRHLGHGLEQTQLQGRRIRGHRRRCLHDFYAAITGEFPDASVFVYLFPGRSGIDVSPEELAQLTAIDGVAGAKLSGRPNDQFARYVELAAPGSLVYSGDDSSYPHVAAAGEAGIVSGVSSAFPELFGQLTRALLSASASCNLLARARGSKSSSAT